MYKKLVISSFFVSAIFIDASAMNKKRKLSTSSSSPRVEKKQSAEKVKEEQHEELIVKNRLAVLKNRYGSTQNALFNIVNAINLPYDVFNDINLLLNNTKAGEAIDINYRDKWGHTFLSYATHFGHVDLVKLFLQKGALVHAANSKSPLVVAANGLNPAATLPLLLQAGGDVAELTNATFTKDQTDTVHKAIKEHYHTNLPRTVTSALQPYINYGNGNSLAQLVLSYVALPLPQNYGKNLNFNIQKPQF
jgi:hypothetical protein